MARDLTPEQEIPVMEGTTPSRPPPAVPIRQSAQKKVPLVTPGFVPTQSDSRRALQVQSLVSTASQNSASADTTETVKNIILTNTTVNPEIIYDIVQDSDEENTKTAANSVTSKQEKKLAPRKDGTDSVLNYFSQIGNTVSYNCVWCLKTVKASTSSYYNLKVHRDGSNIKGTIRGACPSREKAIAAGSKLPRTAAQCAKEDSEAIKNPGNTLASYVTKGRFDNNTLNKMMVFWLIRQSLPWARFEDEHLCISLNLIDPRANLYSRTWAAKTAGNLYLALQKSVLDDINLSLGCVDN
ncbi:hypothetical protein PGT21_021231 [Puccinia graminis f. sp. tritici]|uniref:BED-type domain-containing protein n=1 Tax=Puccinia graminis f. sp. tritici TaxID=56615 RepID=A0A5B0MMS7_PUCGR|nr:hypothetical protein PGT21_021231 [Puccinia graminis f. sp. tritici]